MDFAALDWFQYLNLRSNAFPQRVVGYHIQLGVDFYKKNPGGYFSVNNVFVAETATLFYDIADNCSLLIRFLAGAILGCTIY